MDNLAELKVLLAGFHIARKSFFRVDGCFDSACLFILEKSGLSLHRFSYSCVITRILSRFVTAGELFVNDFVRRFCLRGQLCVCVCPSSLERPSPCGCGRLSASVFPPVLTGLVLYLVGSQLYRAQPITFLHF